jgi:hypothetical protein
VVDRDRSALAAFFAQADLPAASGPEVIPDVRTAHCRDPGEGVCHDADGGPVAQLRQILPVGYDRVEKLAGLLGGQGWGFAAISV